MSGARPLAVVLGAVLTGVLAGGLGLGTVAAAASVTENTAQPSEQVVRGEHLLLTTIGDPAAMADLAPNEVVQWQVGIDVMTDEPGQVSIGLSGVGSAVLGLETRVNACAERWVDGLCASGATVVRAAHRVPLDGVQRVLGTMVSAEQRWLLFDVWRGDGGAGGLAEGGAAARGGDGSVQLVVHAAGMGDELTASAGQSGALPGTGVNPVLPAFVAGGSVLLGLLVAALAEARARARTRDRDQNPAEELR